MLSAPFSHVTLAEYPVQIFILIQITLHLAGMVKLICGHVSWNDIMPTLTQTGIKCQIFCHPFIRQNTKTDLKICMCSIFMQNYVITKLHLSSHIECTFSKCSGNGNFFYQLMYTSMTQQLYSSRDRRWEVHPNRFCLR